MSTDLILIADGNPGRGQRIANALEAAGRPCRVAPQGAKALEIALSEQPRLIVCQVDLPLVEAAKLEEILRANPRTRSVRFLFLGGAGSGATPIGGVGDETLEAGAEINEILDAVDLMVERLERIESLEQRASTERELEGDLSELSPSELLQMLSARGATGRLILTPELEDGSSPDGMVLVVDGEIHSAQAGAVRAEKALFRILDWRVGEFHFEPTEIEGPAEILTPTRSVLAEGLRQLDEWNRLAPKLPPLESPVKLAVDRGELPNMVHPLTQEVLGLLEKVDRVGDVVDQCGQSDYQVLRTLHTLADRGIVELGRARIAPTQKTGHALFNEAQARRLRAFSQTGLARETLPPNGKLLVVAASGAVATQFADLLRKVPGAELAPSFDRGGLGEGDLETMARIAVDSDFGIDLVHLPTDEAHAPLWNFAAYRALGTIFLLDARVGTSAAELGSMSDVLARPAGARTFHVVMLAEGERLSPDELRENLSLIDEASLFLLPIESSKDPSSLLRSLFARIVP